MGYLPFGDDNQIINRLCNYHHVPMEGKQISEGKSILVLLMYNLIIVLIFPSEYEQLVRSLLTVDVTVRPFITEVLSHMWMTSFPSVRPSWEGPCGGKHTIQNSLPSIFHSVDSSTPCYDVEVHSPRLPSNDQQDTMNAMDTTDPETALPVRDSSGSEVQEEHLIPANNTVLSASVSCSKEHDSHPLNSATNCPSLADELAFVCELISINNPLPESAASTTQLAKSASLTSVKQDSLTADEAGKISMSAESESSTSVEQDHNLKLSTNINVRIKSVTPLSSVEQSNQTTDAALPAKSLSFTSIRKNNHQVNSAATTTLLTRSVTSTLMEQDNSSSASNIKTTAPGQSISLSSVKQTNHPSDPANNNLFLAEPESSPVLEQDNSLGQADNSSQPASNATTPDVHGEASPNARSRHMPRKRRNMISRLQSAVCRRIFSTLRRRFNVL